MNAPQQTQCFDRLTLERLLAEQLQGDEETAVLVHIETCEGCRNQLAAIAGHAELDPEIREHFTDESFDGPGAATVLEGEAEEADIEQIKALLGPTDDPQMLGRIGHYEINGIVGRGSTGIVFKATDKRLNRFVAIKMLAPSYAGSGPARQRFAREARSIAAVRDEHVIPVFGVDEHKGLPFIVMEYMPGGSLAQRIEEQGRLDTCEVVRLGMQIARALQAAHAQGIVHRDVKPANVLLEAGIDRALVTDFGLARILDESSMTRSGAISGTPQFMSPEQAAGESVDHRSDLFSLGSVMYMACTGHSPFRSETVFGVIKRVCENEPRPIRETNPGIKQWLCDFVQKLQAKDVTQRFQSAKEVADYLAAELAYLQSPTSIPKPNRLWRPEPVPTTTDKTPARKLAVAASVVGVVAFAIFGLSQLQSGAKDQEPPANGGQVKTLAAQDKQDLPKAGLQLALAASGEEPKQPSEFERAVVFLDAKEYDEAIQLFKSSFDDNENEGESAYNIACCYALSDRAGDAIPWLEKAIEAGFINTNHYKSDTDLKSLRGTDKFEELLARMQKIERAEKLVARGVQLRRQGRYVDANEVYIEVLDQFPTNSAAILEYGLSLHLKGDLDEALKWHRRAAETKETADYGNYNIACYHSLKGQTDKAFEYFRKGIKAGMTDIRHFEEDSDLDAIRDDPRYQTMLDLAESELRKSWSDEEKQCHRMIVAVKTKDYNTLERLLQDADKNCSCPDPRSVRRSLTPPRQTPLAAACEIGDLKAVKMIVEAGSDADFMPQWEPRPLMIASRYGHSEVAKYLLSRGAKINSNVLGMGTPLSFAAAGNHVDVLRFLLSEGAKVDLRTDGVGTPLLVAAKNNSVESVRLLLNRNANINTKIPGVGTALSVAAREGNVEMLKLLLSEGAQIDAKIDGVGTPLSVAIRAGAEDAVRSLIESGAEIDAPVAGAGTPLSAAASVGKLDMMKLLISQNADLNSRAHGVGSALCVAARRGELDAIKLLLEAGANPNRTIEGVGTPLATAVKSGEAEIVKLLLKYNANPKAKSPGQRSALAVARECDDEAMLKLLSESSK